MTPHCTASAGVSLALTLALKFGGILFLPYLVVKRRWDILVPCTLVLACMVAVLITRIAPQILLDYFTIHAPAVTKVYRGVSTNFSLWTIPYKVFEGATPVPFFANGVVSPPLFDRKDLTGIGTLFVVGPALASCYFFALRSRCSAAAIMMLIAGSTVLTPSTWHHSLLLLALPVAFLIKRRCAQLDDLRSLLGPTFLAIAASFGSALCWFILDLPADGAPSGVGQEAVVVVPSLPMLMVSLTPTVIVASIIWMLYRENGAELSE